MKRPLKMFKTALVCLLVNFTAHAQLPKDYFKLPSLLLKNTEYKLSFSTHPESEYYKQEYLAAGEDPARFKTMVWIDVIRSGMTLERIVEIKTAELQKRKKTDKLCNYKILDNEETGEYLIEFLMSAKTADNVDIVEWNAYRYKGTIDRNGKKGIMLFAMSKRAYGKEVPAFMETLKKERGNYTAIIGDALIPKIRL